MGKINVLGFEIANLIAAGEVVDRPSSVLKELLENAIDAGSTRIEAEIARGGVRSIRVTDNGCGMTPDDLPVAIRRHATSKIQAAEDLDSIFTLGFRGEALAAISSVSDIRILSKTKEAAMGTMLVAESGVITDLTEVGCADGTTVLVENIFAKIPARRKFLKKDATEAMSCTAQMEKIAMSHPEIAFRFTIDGHLKFATTGDGNPHSTLYAIYGREFASGLLAVDGGNDAVAVTGYVGKSDNSHGNRNMQNVFINGRYVKSKTVGAALERAYTSYMAPERFPVACLYLSIDPRHVDVNVHPAKLEVRFSDERVVFEAVYYAVRSVLENNTSRPEMQLPTTGSTPKMDYRNAFVPVGAPKPTQLSYDTRMTQPPPAPPVSLSDAPAVSSGRTPMLTRTPTYPPSEQRGEGRPTTYHGETLTPQETQAFVDRLPLSHNSHMAGERGVYVARTAPTVPFPEVEPPSAHTPVSAPVTEAVQPPPYRYVGQAFRTYLFVELEGDVLLVIDQHAAHERIIFENLLANRQKEGRITSQSMLVPMSVMLTPEELAVAIDHKAELEAIGFSFLVEEGGVSLVSIPDAITPDGAGELFEEVVGGLLTGSGTPENTWEKRWEKSLYQIACKAAIKGGRHYGEAQLDWLIRQVLTLPDITVCPHGRPIAYRLTKGELDRQFDRIK